MSNQVLNVWFIQGDADEMRELYERSFGDSAELSFTGVVPIEEGKEREQWGCNSDARMLQRPYLRWIPGSNELYFETAFFTNWSPPIAWLEQVMKMFPNTSIKFYYTDEAEIAGLIVNHHGTREDEQFEPRTEEFYAFIKEFPVDVRIDCLQCGENLKLDEYLHSDDYFCTTCTAKSETRGDHNG